MMNDPIRILQIIEKSVKSSPVGNELAAGDFNFETAFADSCEQFVSRITEYHPDLVITDYQFSSFEGIPAIKEAKEIYPETAFIVFTDKISENDAIGCIKAGVSNIVNSDQLSGIFLIVQETLKFQQARLEKKHIEDQLAKEREILSISLASIGEAIISIDLTGKIVLFNQAAQQITGYSISEAVEQPVQKVLQILDEKTNTILEDPIFYLLDIEEKIEKGEITKRPILVKKNKEKVLISGKITSIVVDQKKNAGYVIVFDDVTQKELSAAQSMLSLKMESIGQLAAGIAHEINTPVQYLGDNLNFINRTFETLREMDIKQLNFLTSLSQNKEIGQQAMDLIELRQFKKIDHFFSEVPVAISESLEGVERVRKIVMAIREFSHPSQKVNTLSDINKGIQTTVTISKNEWKYCSDLETILDPDLPLVWCKIDEINQVLLNMIVNATHAIQEKQKTTDKNKGKITISTSQKDEQVLITVTDTGCGIPEDLVNRIFDPFFTTKEVGKGTGQGLSLAHNIIVNHHRGSITVDSIVNKGTTFTIKIPIAPQESEENRDQ